MELCCALSLHCGRGAVGFVMGSMSASSFRCCMFVSYMYPVAVLNAALCMTVC